MKCTGVESPAEVGAQVDAGQVGGRDVQLAQHAARVVPHVHQRLGHRRQRAAQLATRRRARCPPAAAAAALPAGALLVLLALLLLLLGGGSGVRARGRRVLVEGRLARALRRRLRLVVGVLGVLVLNRLTRPLLLRRPAAGRGPRAARRAGRRRGRLGGRGASARRARRCERDGDGLTPEPGSCGRRGIAGRRGRGHWLGVGGHSHPVAHTSAQNEPSLPLLHSQS